MRRLALLLASILGSADTARAVCSSLDGPRCELINGRAALARAPPPPPQDRTSWRERLAEVVRAHLQGLADSDDGHGEPPLHGAFDVEGRLPDSDGEYMLWPGAWREQPKGWITVGLKGGFEDNVTLSGEIFDEDGQTMSACSRFALTRHEESPAASDEQWRHSLFGSWHGVYVCGGTPTRLRLTLEPDHAEFPTQVKGLFDFTVLRDMSATELSEVTRLVSESLLDLGIDGENVQIIVVDDEGGEEGLGYTLALDDDDV